MAIKPSFQRLRSLIGQDRVLAALLPEAERLAAVNQRLSRAVPARLADACKVVSTRNGEALVYCDSGVAAARLRSLATSAARALSTPDCRIERLRIRVRTEDVRREVRPKAGLGPTALTAWNELDHTLPACGLKDAIAQLLRHHRSQG
jgi:hypothetical protein